MNLKLSEKIKEDIYKQMNIIKYLSPQLDEENRICLERFQGAITVQQQFITNALSNSFASLIDYYFIYCVLSLGGDIDKIKRVQYINVGRNFIFSTMKLSDEERKKISWEQYTSFLEDDLGQDEVNRLNKNQNNYNFVYVKKALRFKLKNFGLDIDNNELIRDFHECIMFLYCTPFRNTGVKYTIYLDINNYLKHNALIHTNYSYHTFESPSQTIVYTTLEIKNDYLALLSEGFLKDVAETRLESLKNMLEVKKIDNFSLCDLENKWGIGCIIKIDPNNGYLMKDNSAAFYLDGILIFKTENSILVDLKSLNKKIQQELFSEIDRGIKYLAHQKEMEKFSRS